MRRENGTLDLLPQGNSIFAVEESLDGQRFLKGTTRLVSYQNIISNAYTHHALTLCTYYVLYIVLCEGVLSHTTLKHTGFVDTFLTRWTIAQGLLFSATRETNHKLYVSCVQHNGNKVQLGENAQQFNGQYWRLCGVMYMWLATMTSDRERARETGW